MDQAEETKAEGERRIAAGRVATWFASELASVLGVLRETVTAAPAVHSRDADLQAATRVQTAARACGARMSSLLGLREEPIQRVESSPNHALQRLLAEHPTLRERRLHLLGLDAVELPLSAAALRTIMGGLLDNALEASPDPPRIEVMAAGEGRGALWVTSTAALSPEDACHAAFPFFSTKPGHQGLGLSLAHAMAENQGGRLELEPGPGRTRVGVVFPGPHPARDQAADSNLTFTCHLAAGLAHDVNNALMAALGWAEILADARDEAERQESLATMSQAADYLEAMSYLLPYGEGPSAAAHPLDLGGALERMRPLLRAVLEHKSDRKIALCVRPVQGARVAMSEDALRSVVLRLAENARESMPTGGTWTISCDVSPQDLLLTLSPEVRAKDQTFEPSQKGARRKQSALGLAVLRDLVHASGGTLEIDQQSPSQPRDSSKQSPPIPAARIRLPGAPS